jgi:hypothetical protein
MCSKQGLNPQSFLPTLQGLNHQAITLHNDKKIAYEIYIYTYFEQKNDFFISLFDFIDLVGLLLH